MIKVLHLCLGLYNFWTTYEGEYINESLLGRQDIDLKVWGRDRIGYVPNLTATDIVSHLYGDEHPDIIIVHSSMEKHDHPEDQKCFNGLQDLRQKSIIFWRTFDCFGKKADFYINQIKRYKPQKVLVWYPDHAEYLQQCLGGISEVHFFPHSVGRRYYNKMCERSFDLALIGRCDLNGRRLSEKNFSVKTYVPPKRDTRALKGANLINDLNMCKFSWNSPVGGKYCSLRFVEAPACGTISLIPSHFDQLDLYFPRDNYVICNSSTKSANKVISRMSAEEYTDIQQKAYKTVINNHSTDRRIDLLLDLAVGKKVKYNDYYKI